jgi:hypothetical protein
MRYEEKSLISNRCSTVSELIESLLLIEEKFGNIAVGDVPTLRPSISVDLYKNGGNPIVILS